MIPGGRCVDPETGLHAVRNVGIKGGRIAAISKEKLEGQKTLNAEGQIVAPGFIDLHAHGQQLPAAWMQAFDGVTTALELESGLLPVGKFYEDVAKEGRPINYGTGAAWTYARVATKEPEFDPPDATLGWFQRAFALKNWQNSIATDEELAKIIDLVEQGLKEGGLGVSINAGYAPGYGHKEYHALAELAKKHDVPTFTHVRYLKKSEPSSTWEAYQEQISLAALTGAHLHVCHLNSTSLSDIEDCANLIKQAQSRSLPVTVEAYTYGAGSSAVGAELFRGPDWLDRWGIADASAMEFNGVPLDQAKIDEMQKSSPGDVVVIHFLRPDQSKEDQRLLELAKRQISAADVAVLNKVDLVDADGLKRAQDWVQELAPDSRALEVTNGHAPLELILGVGGACELDSIDGAKQAPSHSADSFESFTWESNDPVSMQTLNSVLGRLPKTVFRTKGFLYLSEKPNHRCILQATSGRAAITVGQPWGDETPKSRIVFIGSRGGVNSSEISELFHEHSI